MSEWQNLNIESICKKIIDYRGKTPEKVSYGTKLITSKVIKNNRILDNANFEYIRDDKYEEVMRRGKPELFDILFTTEAPLGEVALIKNDEKIAIAQRIILLRANTDKVTPHFLFYSLIGPLGYGRIQQKGTGTTVLGIKNPELKKVILPIPPLPTQRKIAKILSNYDDLIENNLKRIKLLEESARLTYEEWFLRFRIDGKKLEIDPESGLPFGWEKVKLKNFCILTMGQSPKSEFYNETGDGSPFHQGVTNYGFRFPSNTTWSTRGLRIAEEGDILFSVRAPVGRLNVSMEKIILGRGLASIRQIHNLNSFLFYQLQNIFFEDNLMGSGAIFDSVTKRDVEDIKLIYSKSISGKFNALASTIDDEIKNLTNQNKLLKEARDILLPRLMTNMIDTDDLDVAV